VAESKDTYNGGMKHVGPVGGSRCPNGQHTRSAGKTLNWVIKLYTKTNRRKNYGIWKRATTITAGWCQVLLNWV